MKYKRELNTNFNYLDKQTCSNCEHLKFIRRIETDCCDYSLYKCLVKNEYIDEFHKDFKACDNFYFSDVD